MSKLLEEKAIGTALKSPEATQVVDIRPEWFASKSLRSVYNAINTKPTGDLLDIYASAHNDFDYNGRSDDLEGFKARAMFGGPDYLKVYAKKLYKSFLVRKISVLATKYAQGPQSKVREKLVDYADKMRNLSVDRNSNHTPDACDELLHDLDHKKPVGIKSYDRLDFVLGGGLYKSCLLTIGASTGVGKTSYAINIMIQALKHNKDLTVDYFTEEMDAKEIVDRVISNLTGISNFKLRNPYNRVHNSTMKEIIAGYAKQLKASNMNIYDTAYSITDIASIIKGHAGNLKDNKYLAIVDYIGLVNTPRAARTPRYLQIGEITRTLKMLTTNFGIPIIELTQLNRNIAERYSAEPELSDIRESGSVEQDSNVVILLYNANKKDKETVTAKVAKNRSGMTTKILYTFNKDEMKFTELGGKYETSKRS